VLRREMSLAAHEWARQYSWQRIVDRMEVLYSEVLGLPEG
jgi:hypothetical protein